MDKWTVVWRWAVGLGCVVFVVLAVMRSSGHELLTYAGDLRAEHTDEVVVECRDGDGAAEKVTTLGGRVYFYRVLAGEDALDERKQKAGVTEVNEGITAHCRDAESDRLLAVVWYLAGAGFLLVVLAFGILARRADRLDERTGARPGGR